MHPANQETNNFISIIRIVSDFQSLCIQANCSGHIYEGKVLKLHCNMIKLDKVTQIIPNNNLFLSFFKYFPTRVHIFVLV
jgi:hypothetical protein